jgi:hypothetical protein
MHAPDRYVMDGVSVLQEAVGVKRKEDDTSRRSGGGGRISRHDGYGGDERLACLARISHSHHPSSSIRNSMEIQDARENICI